MSKLMNLATALMAASWMEQEVSKVDEVGLAIAKAFAGLSNNYHPYETAFSPEAAAHLGRAAIEELRRADGPMAQEGAEAINPYVERAADFKDNVEVALDVWHAMIDQALK